MSGGVCGDNRFDIIAAAKDDIIRTTNIETRPDEMAVLDSVLFRAWQMGWLTHYGADSSVVRVREPLQQILRELRRHREGQIDVAELCRQVEGIATAVCDTPLRPYERFYSWSSALAGFERETGITVHDQNVIQLVKWLYGAMAPEKPACAPGIEVPS